MKEWRGACQPGPFQHSSRSILLSPQPKIPRDTHCSGKAAFCCSALFCLLLSRASDAHAHTRRFGCLFWFMFDFVISFQYVRLRAWGAWDKICSPCSSPRASSPQAPRLKQQPQVPSTDQRSVGEDGSKGGERARRKGE